MGVGGIEGLVPDDQLDILEVKQVIDGVCATPVILSWEEGGEEVNSCYVSDGLLEVLAVLEEVV